jgi:hypothetical protein
MTVFVHHIYEFRKGLRNLVLYTGPACEREAIERRLRTEQIASIVQPVGAHRINVFFGNAACVEIVRRFASKPLSLWSPEEDFMLGILLGYDRIQQSVRYLQRAGRAAARGLAEASA